MSRGYSVSGPNATGSATKTLVTIIASTTARPAVFDTTVGNQNTPADQACLLALTLFTAVGTAGSSPTPQKLDSAAVASVTTAGITHSAEPTYASTDLLQIPLNQRASFRWVASPGYEFIAPATASNGIGLRLVAATASLIQNGTVFFFE